MLRRLLLVAAFLLLGSAPMAHGQTSDTPKKVILLIPDGFGPASHTMGRDMLRALRGQEMTVLDSLQTGSVHTYSTSQRITDSAAGATAYATGVKTYNGAIAVNPKKQPLGTILEAAEARGMATGLVATSRITHATPAAFAAHVPDRDQENEIAAQMLKHNIEVVLGGGRRHFLPTSDDGRRADGRNLIEAATADGYRYAATAKELAAIEQPPVLGLFAASHMAYEIDRETTQQPSLAEMARTAIDLVKDDPEGYFLMIEGSRIDHAGHANDAAAHAGDILAFYDAVQVALDAARAQGNTLVVVVSDHATGGLSLAREVDGESEYHWYPKKLAQVQASHGAMYAAAKEAREPAKVVQKMLGFSNLTDEERKHIAEAATIGDVYTFGGVITDIVGRRVRTGWTTHGHTARDVNLYAFGPGRAHFIGHHDNTYVGDTLARLMGVNLDAQTAQLRKDMASKAAAGK
ncbi:alkaline phosphatase [Salisaeta longa]|uniref:alkaline phosphatase n=1 Tax=Salisaeta longa TaxID=503170 RepID=UPI0003B32D21|nr:alkaline phosphatase [Salisaeta longa]